jgi:hypothetical protein
MVRTETGTVDVYDYLLVMPAAVAIPALARPERREQQVSVSLPPLAQPVESAAAVSPALPFQV